jgi:hypothetical protein
MEGASIIIKYFFHHIPLYPPPHFKGKMGREKRGTRPLFNNIKKPFLIVFIPPQSM